MSCLIRAVDILYFTTENLGKLLNNYLKQETLDRQNDFLNLTKMVIYLLVANVRAIDVFVKNKSTPAQTGRKNKKSNINDSLPDLKVYQEKRYNVLIQICNIMQMPIDRLWPMSIVEEDFVKYVLNNNN